MTLSRVTKVLAAVVLAGYLLTLFTSHFALSTLKVGGDLYNRIAMGKDLVADILPPPAYLIEAYLEATLALGNQRETGTRPDAASEIAGHVAKLKVLQKDYETRHAFWREQVLEAPIAAALLKASYEPGVRFWKLIDDGFVPALEKGDRAEAARLYAELAEAYRQHRAAVDKTVELANAANDRLLAEAATDNTMMMALMWGVGFVVLLLVMGGAAGVLLAILAPMNRIKGAMGRLAAGDNALELADAQRKNEIGEMAQAVEVFRRNALERERLGAAMERTRQAEIKRQQSLDKHLHSFKDTIASNIEVLLREVSDLRGTAATLLAKAGEASQQATSSANSCTTAAAGSQAVATATEELNASIREIATQANSTSSIVAQTTERTQRTDGEVSNLLHAVSKIETVVTLIRQIAQQTNLLALNATIESARAGEAGRGFAVVAAEVKALSEQTAKATEEIAGQINTVQTTTNAAATAVRAIGTSVADIQHLAASVAAAVEEQQAATADIARNVSIVAEGSNSAAESSRIVTDVADLTGAEAKRLAAASDELHDVSNAVSKAVEDFIEAITLDLNERRLASRQSVDRSLVIVNGDQHHRVPAINVSDTGMRVGLMPGTKKGDQVEIRLGSQAIKAEVVWVSDKACGLRFVDAISRDILVEAGLLAEPGRSQAA